MTIESNHTNGTTYKSHGSRHALENGFKRLADTSSGLDNAAPPPSSSTSSSSPSFSPKANNEITLCDHEQSPSIVSPSSLLASFHLHDQISLESSQQLSDSSSPHDLNYKQRVKKIASAVLTILECLPEDSRRDGLQKTPERYAEVRLSLTLQFYGVRLTSYVFFFHS